MLTILGEPTRIVPGQFESAGTTFEGHAFFEASSIRKINGIYYFIYSSQASHELCYATSPFPDRGFVYRGVIISNGDIGYRGRAPKDRLAVTGNNHGSIEYVNGKWYVFYHRQTHKTTFSRQGCAEPIQILPDGRIPQVEMTSCGLNGGPLAAEGTYPAAICCNLTNGHMPHQGHKYIQSPLPHITHEENRHYIAEIGDGTLIRYKYFLFDGRTTLTLRIRGKGSGSVHITAAGKEVAVLPVCPSEDWINITAAFDISGQYALQFSYAGSGFLELESFTFGNGTNGP